MKKRYKVIVSVAFALLALLLGVVLAPAPSGAVEPVNEDYTATPVFLTNAVPPNILIILDNSGSMNFAAYGTWNGFGGEIVDEPYPQDGTLNIQVSQSSDDSEEDTDDTTNWFNSEDLDLGGYAMGAGDALMAVRFQNLGIPQGSTITTAYITFEANADLSNETNITIYGQAADDTATFTTTNEDISGRLNSAASVSWAIPASSPWTTGTTYNTPELKTILQEVVNRSQWETDSAIVFKFSGTGKRDARSYDYGDHTHGPILHIEYVAAIPDYYGYFNSSLRYVHANSKFRPATAAEIAAGGTWDGNFLNWLAMRRVDVVRKVLMGGLATPRTTTGTQTLYAEANTNYGANYMKRYNGTGVSPYDGDYYYGVGADAKIYVDTDANPFDTGSANTFAINVDVDAVNNPDDFMDLGSGLTTVGVLQKVGDRANWGNMWFDNGTGNNDSGGLISNPMGVSQTTLMNDLQNRQCDTWTPLAEAYYVAMHYYMQTDVEEEGNDLDYQNAPAGPFNDVNDPYVNSSGDVIECAQSFVLLLTDGASTVDAMIPDYLKNFGRATLGEALTTCTSDGDASCPLPNGGTDFLKDVALYARTVDLRPQNTYSYGDGVTATATANPKALGGQQNILLYAIYAFGNDDNARTVLKAAARNGGFNEKDGNWGPTSTSEWDEDGDGDPDTYYESDNAGDLAAELLKAITDILQRASAGTAVSVLSTSSEGEGSLVQAYFKPSVSVGTEDVEWVGYLQALWVDSLGRLREDTDLDSALTLDQDKIIEYHFDGATGESRFYRYELDADGNRAFNDANSNGVMDTGETYIFTDHLLEEMVPLWEAGDVLAGRTPSTRAIKTFVDLDNDGVVDSGEFLDFDVTTGSNWSNIRPFLGVADDSAWSYLGFPHDDRVKNLIQFIRGENSGWFGTGPVTIRLRTINGQVWKLGDIVHSTPVTLGRPLDNYGLIYGDPSYQNYLAKYRDREQVVYVGANDGMLHAFLLGKFNQGDNASTGSITEEAYFTKENTTTESFGDELWGYIPQALLPHLKWLAKTNYKHVYYVDLRPRVFDARIFTDDADTSANSLHPGGWGTILVCGLNMGGKYIWSTDTFPEGAATRSFYSVYFAIDVTDPHNPTLLWERTYPNLALTTSVPTIARVGEGVNDANATWYLVFGSGPGYDASGPLSWPICYEGKSDQYAHIYVVNLKTGALLRNYTAGEDEAFFGAPITVDMQLDFGVDIGYIGETYDTNQGWQGKMYRFRVPLNASDEYEPLGASAPSNWTFSEMFEAGGPLTSAPSASLDEYDNLWIYFGSGRYMAEADKTDASTQYFYGMKDPWYNSSMYSTTVGDPDYAGSKILDHNDLLDATNIEIYTDGTTSAGSWSSLVSSMYSTDGWLLELTTSGERVLNKPTVVGGIVLTPTFIPNTDPCGFGGDANLLGLYYETGTAFYDPVFQDAIETVTVGGQQKTKVLNKVSLGVGKGSKVGIHVGMEEGARAYTQKSTGVIVDLDINPAFDIKSGFIYWRER